MPGKLERNRKKVVKDLASGRPQAEIAREVGINRASVCRFVKREDVKKEMEKEALRLLEALPDAVQNIKDLVWGMKSLPDGDHKNRELGYRASLKVLETAGIANTQVQNQIMVNIFNNNKTLISPLLITILDKHLTNFPDDPIDYDELNND
jgi:hypothetical protein